LQSILWGTAALIWRRGRRSTAPGLMRSHPGIPHPARQGLPPGGKENKNK
jgi:hypothetical protein